MRRVVLVGITMLFGLAAGVSCSSSGTSPGTSVDGARSDGPVALDSPRNNQDSAVVPVTPDGQLASPDGASGAGGKGIDGSTGAGGATGGGDAPAAGGAPGFDGSSNSIDASGAAGTTGSGGSSAEAGAAGAGGAADAASPISTGGTLSSLDAETSDTGGAIGIADGAAATGGAAGTSSTATSVSTGGITGTGGAVSTGGITGTGGAVSTGGITGTGGTGGGVTATGTGGTSAGGTTGTVTTTSTGGASTLDAGTSADASASDTVPGDAPAPEDGSSTVTGENSQVVVPPGANGAGVAITIEKGTAIPTDGEWTYSPAGAPVRFGPSGATFSKPVKITLTYETSLVGTREDLFVVAHRDDLTHAVTFIHPDSIVGSQVSVSATSFSTFQPVVYTELMTGVVRDRDTNQPVRGAQVFFYGSGYGNAVTDANGAYSFTIEKLSSFGGALSGTLYVGADGHFEAPSIAVTDLGSQPSLPVVNDVTLLSSGPLVTGVVTNTHDGTPIAGATISFSRSPASTFRGGASTVTVTTDTDGHYAIDASFFAENPSGDFGVNLMVNASGYLGVTKNLTFHSGPVTQSFTLNSSTGNLMTGVVRDRNTNAPIAGAGVFFYGSGYGNAVTDAAGAYALAIEQLSSFGGALSGTLYIGANGYFEAHPVAVTDLGSQTSLPVVNDVTLLPSSPLVTGVVTSTHDLTPIAGATISFNRSPASTFRGGASTVTVTTDTDGHYAIDASYFAENPSGDFTVNLMVNPTGYLGATKNLTFHGGPVTQNFALNSSAGNLMTGVVRDRNTNVPIVGAGIFFYGTGYGNAVTDANGAYSFTIEKLSSFGGALSGTLYIGADGHFEAPVITVSDLAAQPSLPVVNDATLLPSGPLVTGVVTDAHSAAPIAGATILFNRSPASTFRGGATTVTDTTGSDGHYAIDASFFAENPSGDFTVNLMANASGYLGGTKNITFHTGPTTEDFQLTSGTGS